MHRGKREIGRILHRKFEIRNLKLDRPIPDFGSAMEDLSDFRIPLLLFLIHGHEHRLPVVSYQQQYGL
jgi:hypothetical protein